MLSAVIRWESSYSAVPTFVEQPTHQGFPHPSPLVLGTNLLKFQTGIQDRDRTGLRRSEPSSRTTLTGEQPDPWELLHPQDVMHIIPLLPKVQTISSPLCYAMYGVG